MPYLIDTDIYSYYIKGNLEIRKRFEAVGVKDIWISRITVLELQVLAYRRDNPKHLLDAIDNIISYFNFVDLDNDSFGLFGKEKARIINAGLPPGERGDFDILQACIAKANGLTIVTNNERHFTPLGVQLENWTR